MKNSPRRSLVKSLPAARKPVVLSIRNLSVNFGSRRIVSSLDCDLEKGDVLAVIGANGSGKTVFVRTLLGLVPHGGTIHWIESAVLGYVPQRISLDRQLPLRARDLLHAKAGFLRYPAKEIDHIAETIGLSQTLLDSPVSELSGGQFQKVLIAFGLFGHPNVLLFDEPTTSLDGSSEEHFYEALRELNQGHGVTIVLVTHDLDVVSNVASKVVYLDLQHCRVGSPRAVLVPEVVERLRSVPLHLRGAE